jgi:hypothetical protein
LDETTEYAVAVTRNPSILQRLTTLRLGYRVYNAELNMIGGCTGLRALCLRSTSFTSLLILVVHATLHCPAYGYCLPLTIQLMNPVSCVAALVLRDEPLPLQCPQLTQLQLCGHKYTMTHVLAMVSQLPQLEILEVLGSEDPNEHEALALSQLPNLQTVNLSKSLLSELDLKAKPASTMRRVHSHEQMSSEMREHRECQELLQEAAPDINWVRETPVPCSSDDDDEYGFNGYDDEYGNSADDEW